MFTIRKSGEVRDPRFDESPGATIPHVGSSGHPLDIASREHVPLDYLLQ